MFSLSNKKNYLRIIVNTPFLSGALQIIMFRCRRDGIQSVHELGRQHSDV